MDVDGDAMRSPVERLKYPRPYSPTIEVNWVLVDRGRVEAILARLREIPIPLVVNHRVGLDGTTVELSVGNTRISWWQDLPEEWQALGPVIVDLTQYFDQAWASGATAEEIVGQRTGLPASS
jgi:hypothetical protein